jgi:hypothetical protein
MAGLRIPLTAKFTLSVVSERIPSMISSRVDSFQIQSGLLSFGEPNQEERILPPRCRAQSTKCIYKSIPLV